MSISDVLLLLFTLVSPAEGAHYRNALAAHFRLSYTRFSEPRFFLQRDARQLHVFIGDEPPGREDIGTTGYRLLVGYCQIPLWLASH